MWIIQHQPPHVGIVRADQVIQVCDLSLDHFNAARHLFGPGPEYFRARLNCASHELLADKSYDLLGDRTLQGSGCVKYRQQIEQDLNFDDCQSYNGTYFRPAFRCPVSRWLECVGTLDFAEGQLNIPTVMSPVIPFKMDRVSSCCTLLNKSYAS